MSAPAAGAVSIDTAEFTEVLWKHVDACKISAPAFMSARAALVAYIDAHAAQRYEAGPQAGLAHAVQTIANSNETASIALKQRDEARASLARLVDGITDALNFEMSESAEDRLTALLSAKAEDDVRAATPAPAMGEELSQLREFEEWLNERRGYEVIEVFHEIVAKFRACMALRQPGAVKHAADQADQSGFEAWARKHGGLPLDTAGDAMLTDDKSMALPTYKNSRTEIAWRAWANRPTPAAPVSQPAAQEPYGYVGSHVESAVKGQTRYTAEIRARKSAGFPVALYTAPAPLSAPEWLTSAAPEDGRGFYAYHPSLVHPDFNPWGVVEAVCNGNTFIGAVWDGQHDCWNTLEIQVAAWKPISGPNLPLSAPAGSEQPQ